jgi:hypothetical protein
MLWWDLKFLEFLHFSLNFQSPLAASGRRALSHSHQSEVHKSKIYASEDAFNWSYGWFQDAEFHKHMVRLCLKNMVFNLWSVTWMSLHIIANERVALTGMTRLLMKPSKGASVSDKLSLLELNACCLPVCQLCTLHWMCTVCRPVLFRSQCLNQ